MNVAFFTEGGWTGKVHRNHPNMRTDLAWECVLEADHIPLLHALRDSVRKRDQIYDIGIIIVPKKNIEAYAQFDLMSLRNSGYCKKVTIMQEGPNWFWQDWSLPIQVWYFSAMQNADFLLCHSESDRKYYMGLLGRQDVIKMPTLLLESSVDKKSLTDTHNRSGVMIGGNMVSWYNGFDSYSIATEFGEDLYAPSMGRMQETEDMIEDITYLPYLGWTDWITELSKRKYAVHLIRNRLAGTFALNCAYLGIPCIGYKGLDTQELCHPKTSFEVGDLVEARRIAKHLRDNQEFYNHCSVLARANWLKYYHEAVYVTEFVPKLEELVNLKS